VKVGSPGSAKDKLCEQYNDLSGDRLAEFESFYQTLLADGQTPGLRKVNKPSEWKKVHQDMDRVVSKADVLGGHVFAILVGGNWESKANVVGTARGLSWLNRLNNLHLGHLQFAHYVKNNELSDYMEELQAVKEEYHGSTMPGASLKRSQTAAPDSRPSRESTPPDVRRVKRSKTTFEPALMLPPQAQVVGDQMSNLVPEVSASTIHSGPSFPSLESFFQPKPAGSTAPEANEAPSQPVVPVPLNTRQGQPNRDHRRKQVSDKLLQMFNNHVIPNLTRLPPVPWDAPGGILERNQLKFELPPGWTLANVSLGRNRKSDDVDRVFNELNSQPCTIRLVRK
jgi:hypothetical protein